MYTPEDYKPAQYVKYKFKTTPFEHQKKLIAETWLKPYYALFLEQGCVDCDTEFLTPTGWKKISEYATGDMVLVWDDDYNTHFEIPERFIKEPCNHFIHFKTKYGVDQMLSEEHTMYWLNTSYKLCTCSALEMSDWLNQVKCPQGRRMPSKFTYQGQGVSMSDVLLRLKIAISADGYYPPNKTDRVVVKLRRERKINRLKSLLEEAGIDYRYVLDSRGSVQFSFYTPWCGRDKSLNISFAVQLSRHQLEVVAEEIMLWDGCPSQRTFYACDKDTIDFAQFVFAAVGRATYGVTHDKRIDKYTGAPCYQTGYNKPDGVKHNGYKHLRAGKQPVVPSKDGYKYCFTVSTGKLVLRRNGVIFLTGNCGKSKIAIDTAGVQFMHGLINGMLVIAPKGVYRNWTETEIPIHAPEYLNIRMMAWKPKSQQGRKFSAELEEFVSTPKEGHLDIFAINVDALITQAGMSACERFLKSHDTLAIVDESTRIKNHSAQRTKNAIKLAKLAKYRRILTGTPITTSPLDLYSQCDFLRPSVCNTRTATYVNNPLGFSNFYTFRARYAILKEIPSAGGHAIKFPVAYVNQDELSAKLQEFSSRLTKKECLDLPPKIYQTWNVELTPEQNRMYKQMVTEARVTFDQLTQDRGEIYAQTALTQLLRLHQLSSGFITTEDKQVIEVPNNRLTELLEVVENINLEESKVIIWCHFVPAIEKIISALKEVYGEKSVVHFYGATLPDDRERAKKEFQDPNSPVKFFIGNPASSGMGLTLTQATTVIYYTNSFNLEYRLQSEDRAHRAGQKKSVTYIDFVSTPIDVAVLKKLKSKKLVADLVVDGEILKWL